MPQYSLINLSNVSMHSDVVSLASNSQWCHGFNSRYAAKFVGKKLIRGVKFDIILEDYQTKYTITVLKHKQYIWAQVENVKKAWQALAPVTFSYPRPNIAYISRLEPCILYVSVWWYAYSYWRREYLTNESVLLRNKSVWKLYIIKLSRSNM